MVENPGGGTGGGVGLVDRLVSTVAVVSQVRGSTTGGGAAVRRSVGGAWMPEKKDWKVEAEAEAEAGAEGMARARGRR
jgi:hypothetical protein